MSAPFDLIELVDVELMVVKFLRAQFAENDVEIGVGLVLPPDDDLIERLPFVTVTRAGGLADVRERFDYPLIDLNVYELTNQAVVEAGTQVRKYIHAIRTHRDDTVAPAGGRITDVQEAASPQRLPEDDPLVRLQMQVRLTVRSFPA